MDAANALKEKALTEGNDQVVFLFEYGTALQVAKDYAESTKAFLLAEKLTEIKDYHSLSRIGSSLVLNEAMMQYKGEDYEKVLLNVFLAINFLMEKNFEGALVETKKVNQKLYNYKFEAKRDYEQNPFAFYLAALIWESDRNWDSAYIDFKKAYELAPEVPYLKEDLIRAARRAQRTEDLNKWKSQFKGVKERPESKDKAYGELVLVYKQGWGPIKLPHPEWPRVPKLFPVFSETQQAKLSVVNGPEELSQKIFSIQDVAIKNLDDAYAGLIAKRVAGIATKAVVSDQIRQKNQLLGDLAEIGLNIADQADLRQWIMLPESLHIAKVYLKAGTHKVLITGLNSAGQSTGETTEELEVEIRGGQKTFLSWRSLR